MKVLTNPFGCSVCRMSFTLTKSLKEHVEKTHFKNQAEDCLKSPVLKKDEYATKPTEEPTKGKLI